ncbi:MAG: rhomboid family intramembrane serine protease [Bacteroidales bacterium]|nr:rhomboid family intramembrane serine protease [Bacteroidales bacterium]
MSINFFIIIITCAVSIISFRQTSWFNRLCFSPTAIVQYNQWDRMISYGFVHANWSHLLINMFVLYMFGSIVEDTYCYLWDNWGKFMYLILYLSAIIVSTLPDFIKHKEDYNYIAIGASGATSAIVFASILLFPTQKLYLFFIPIGIPAVIFGIGYLAYSAYMNKHGQDNIGHNTHFWGGIYGFVFSLIFKPQLFIEFLDKIFH